MSQCIKVGNVKQKSMTNITLAASFPLFGTLIILHTPWSHLSKRGKKAIGTTLNFFIVCVTHANCYPLSAIKHLNTNMKPIQCVATFRKINRLGAF